MIKSIDKIELKDKVSEIYSQEKILLETEKRWNNLTINEKKFVIEFLIAAYPESAKVIKEAKWYNTLMDVLGILDPTPIIDTINAISYVSQGDYLYGFLSMISAIPYVGDAVAKPVMEMLKIGKPITKTVEGALNLAKAGKTAEASKIISDAAKQNGLVGKLVSATASWGPKLKTIIQHIPGGKLTYGLRKLLTDWIDLFLGAAKNSQTAVKGLETLAKTGGLTEKSVQEFKAAMQGTNLFRGYKISNPGIITKYFSFTSGYLWKNPSIRSLALRTKWYAGFLAFLGIPGFRTPEQLTQTMSASVLDQKVGQYNETGDAQQNWNSDFAGGESGNNSTQTNTPPPNAPQNNTQKVPSGSFYNTDPLMKLIFGL